ncbi:MAG: hypothetical protein ABIE70_13855 [bacterium]
MKQITLTILIFLVALLALGCTERSSDFTYLDVDPGGLTPGKHVFFDQLLLQILNDRHQLLKFDYYSPEGYFTDINKRAPYLILLAPEGEDEKFYFQHGLKQLADELIATGEIEPMVIFCVQNNPVFGGYFYAGSSYPAGLYDDLLGQAMVQWIDDVLGGTLVLADSAKWRGIGGFGTGAYGAYRAAMLSGKYGSVSGADGPMDFDGADGSSGLIDLMDSVFVEQPQLTAANLRTAYDSSATNPISRMFIGGSLAFSPHDLDLDTLITITVLTQNGVQFNHITIDSTLRGSSYHIIMDSTTLVQNVINQDARNFDFHVPFSFTERPYQGPDTIWGRWLDENLENLLPGHSLSGIDLWLGTNADSRWGYHEMTTSWAQTLQNSGLNPTLETFQGYGSHPTTNSQYVYDIMKRMLIFHSQSFNK